MGTGIDTLSRSAPDAIRDDVKTVIDAMRDAERGQLDGINSETFVQARQRVTDFAQTTCAGGVGSGDG